MVCRFKKSAFRWRCVKRQCVINVFIHDFSAFYNWKFQDKYRSQKKTSSCAVQQNTLTVQSNNTNYPFINPKHRQISLTKKLTLLDRRETSLNQNLCKIKSKIQGCYFSHPTNFFLYFYLMLGVLRHILCICYASHLS